MNDIEIEVPVTFHLKPGEVDRLKRTAFDVDADQGNDRLPTASDYTVEQALQVVFHGRPEVLFSGTGGTPSFLAGWTFEANPWAPSMDWGDAMEVATVVLDGEVRDGHAGGTVMVRVDLTDGRSIVITDGTDGHGDPFSGSTPTDSLFIGLYPSVEAVEQGDEYARHIICKATPGELALALHAIQAEPTTRYVDSRTIACEQVSARSTVDINGDNRFYVMDLDETNHQDLDVWQANGLLVGICDTEAGIIGYTHDSRATQFVQALNSLAITQGVDANPGELTLALDAIQVEPVLDPDYDPVDTPEYEAAHEFTESGEDPLICGGCGQAEDANPAHDMPACTAVPGCVYRDGHSDEFPHRTERT